MKIPFHKPDLPESLDSIYLPSIRDGWLTTGSVVNQFEEELKKYLESEFVILLNSCTAGLHLSLLAKGFSKEDEFILPTLTFASTVECGEYLGLKPNLIDSADDSFLLDLNKVEDKLKSNNKIKAIIPMHYGGEALNMSELTLLALKYNVFIVNDAAHALETEYQNKKIGNTNFTSAFSFYANKNITTGGEGGAVSTNDESIAKKIKKLSLHGISKDGWHRFKDNGRWEYDITELGYKYNLTDLSASFGLWQFKNINKWHKRRKSIAKKYISGLSNLRGITVPESQEGHAWHLFVIRVNLDEWSITRNEIIEKLNKKGIGLAVHYKPIHLLSYYKKNYDLDAENYSNANKLFNTIISLPIYPLLTNSEVDYITKTIKELFSEYSI